MTIALLDADVPGYAGNPFIEAIGPLLSDEEMFRRLACMPAMPRQQAVSASVVLLHHLTELRRLHLPTEEGVLLAQTIHMMVRQGYVHRNPAEVATWRQLYSPIARCSAHGAVQLGATVCGLSGVGKSQSVERSLSLLPQVIEHQKVPGFAGPVSQLVWLKIDVPAAGTITALVEALATATDAALGTNLTKDLFRGRGRRGSTLAMEWLGRVMPFFPGIFVFDEIQNLFKIADKATRENVNKRGLEPSLPRIADDEALKLILTITNLSKVPILGIGTPDGMIGLTRRMSTAQRLVTAGFHRIPHPESADSPIFADQLFRVLLSYQCLPDPIADVDALRRHLFDLTAGIPRICVTLWTKAVAHAVRRGAACLSLEDFSYIASSHLAPVMPAVAALLSKDPLRLRCYEDLMPHPQHFVWG
jgi:hypothetical protein